MRLSLEFDSEVVSRILSMVVIALTSPRHHQGMHVLRTPSQKEVQASNACGKLGIIVAFEGKDVQNGWYILC